METTKNGDAGSSSRTEVCFLMRPALPRTTARAHAEDGGWLQRVRLLERTRLGLGPSLLRAEDVDGYAELTARDRGTAARHSCRTSHGTSTPSRVPSRAPGHFPRVPIHKNSATSPGEIVDRGCAGVSGAGPCPSHWSHE